MAITLQIRHGFIQVYRHHRHTWWDCLLYSFQMLTSVTLDMRRYVAVGIIITVSIGRDEAPTFTRGQLRNAARNSRCTCRKIPNSSTNLPNLPKIDQCAYDGGRGIFAGEQSVDDVDSTVKPNDVGHVYKVIIES